MFDFNNVTNEISNVNDKLDISYFLTQIVPVFKSLYGITLRLSETLDETNKFSILNIRKDALFCNNDIPVHVMKMILRRYFNYDFSNRHFNVWENEVFIVNEHYSADTPFTINIKKNISTEMQQRILDCMAKDKYYIIL